MLVKHTCEKSIRVNNFLYVGKAVSFWRQKFKGSSEGSQFHF